MTGNITKISVCLKIIKKKSMSHWCVDKKFEEVNHES